MGLGFIQPLTEMSNRKLPVGKTRPAHNAANSQPSTISLLCTKCGNVGNSES
jgi:hypothetical protein